MTWEKAGSVSLTQGSNIVNGNGTAFGLAVRVGDAFQGPDGGWYEIVNTQSDIQLSIAPAYKGETVANAAYAVAPVQGYNKASADRLRAATDQISVASQEVGQAMARAEAAADAAQASAGTADSSAASATGSAVAAQADRDAASLSEQHASDAESAARASASEAAGSAANAQTSATAADGSAQAAAKSASDASAVTSGKANKGANSDITSLSGLTTALSIVQGGTGVSNLSALLAALQGVGAFGKNNVLGIVGQTSGVPTGALIERGRNANGDFVRLADGTMICWGQDAAIRNINTAGGASLYYVSAVLPSFPSAFVGIPKVAFSVSDCSSYFSWACSNGAPTQSHPGACFLSSPSSTAAGRATYIAVGSWL